MCEFKPARWPHERKTAGELGRSSVAGPTGMTFTDPRPRTILEHVPQHRDDEERSGDAGPVVVIKQAVVIQEFKHGGQASNARMPLGSAHSGGNR